MATRAGFYKSGKRNKELNRQKKQEAKRQRRLTKGEPSGGGAGTGSHPGSHGLRRRGTGIRRGSPGLPPGNSRQVGVIALWFLEVILND